MVSGSSSLGNFDGGKVGLSRSQGYMQVVSTFFLGPGVPGKNPQDKAQIKVLSIGQRNGLLSLVIRTPGGFAALLPQFDEFRVRGSVARKHSAMESGCRQQETGTRWYPESASKTVV